jgi:hypothetical protein
VQRGPPLFEALLGHQLECPERLARLSPLGPSSLAADIPGGSSNHGELADNGSPRGTGRQRGKTVDALAVFGPLGHDCSLVCCVGISQLPSHRRVFESGTLRRPLQGGRGSGSSEPGFSVTPTRRGAKSPRGVGPDRDYANITQRA